MGIIKDLQEKVDKGEATEDEKKQLKELKAEAVNATTSADSEEDDADSDSGDEEGQEESDEEAVKQLAKEISEPVEKARKEISDLVASLKEDKKDKHFKAAPKLIVDKEMGGVTVKDLSEVKVALPGREGKQVQEVSKATTHFVSALITGDREKLQVLTEGTAALGGNLVPQDFANLIVEDRRDQVVMRQFATVLQLQTDTLNLPTLDTRPHVAWRSEGAVKATTTAQFGNITLTPYSLAGIVTLSNELVADASQGVGGSIVTYVAGLLTRAIAEEEETQFWVGSGSGRPTGVDNYTLTTVNAGAGASDTARADAYKALYYRLPQGYRNNAVWAANASTWARAAQLKESSTNAYLLQRLGDSPIPQIMGRPAYEVNAIGDGKVFFGDFSFYYIGEREGLAVDTSTEATVASQSAFERNLTHVRVEERVDGELASTRAVVEGNNMGAAF